MSVTDPEADEHGVVFRCGRCGAALSAPVRRAPLPEASVLRSWGHWDPPTLMRPGQYAVDPAPFGPPWVPYAQAPGRVRFGGFGRFAGPRNTFVLSPGDARGTRFITDRCAVGCIGLDGSAGPNLACASCGAPVATRVDDCDRLQELRFEPDAVVARGVRWPTSASAVSLDRDTAEEERLGALPDDPDDPPWLEDWRWTAAVTICAARLLIASRGGPVVAASPAATLIDGVLADALKDTSHAGAARTMPVLDLTSPTAWHTTAATAGLDPANATPDHPITIYDLVGPGRPFAPAGATLFNWHQDNTPTTGLRLVAIVPDTARTAEPTGVPADRIVLDHRVWTYLARDQTTTVRSLSRTWWGHGTAVDTYRDEPPPDLSTHRYWIPHSCGRLLIDALIALADQPPPWLRQLLLSLSA